MFVVVVVGNFLGFSDLRMDGIGVEVFERVVFRGVDVYGRVGLNGCEFIRDCINSVSFYEMYFYVLKGLYLSMIMIGKDVWKNCLVLLVFLIILIILGLSCLIEGMWLVRIFILLDLVGMLIWIMFWDL